MLTIEFKVNIVKALRAEAGTVRAIGRVIHRGRRVALTEARLEDALGTLSAHASATQLILD